MGLYRAAAIAGLMMFGNARGSSAGEIQGIVHLEGSVPTPVLMSIQPEAGNHSTEGCGSLTKVSQQLLVDANGGVENAVVWVDMPPEASQHATRAAVSLDQLECEFAPHVVIVPPGGSLAFHNADPVLHNIRIFRGRDRLVEEWQHPRTADLLARFPSPGRYLVRCGVHSWMHAWVIAAEHRYYAVTDASGTFHLPEIPSGRYTLHVWHETLGQQDQDVQVGTQGSFVTVRLSKEGGGG